MAEKIAKIRILPEQLANQIAAGEVVERPASVVKELVENALDASASEILVDIDKGGRGLIRVTDNGCGMSRDDALLCLERHATSKIAAAADLFTLHTMGFRGEALPSIASVSRLRLTTRTVSEEAGWQVYAEGGTVRQAEAVGAPPGTRIEVRDLFFNTPGRRKFLRKDETEFGHIADVLSRIALARPDIRLRLTHNGRTCLDLYRHQSLLERAAALLGRQLVGEMLEISGEAPFGAMLHGLLGAPGLSRSSTSQLYTYINGRFVRDKVVLHAILDAYRTLLEKRRYPVAVLFLDLPPEQVDVNVHPTKHEVRFRDQRQIHDFIVAAVRAQLHGATGAPGELPGRPLAATADSLPASAPVNPSAAMASAATEDRYRQRVHEALQTYREAAKPPTPAQAVATVKGEAFGWDRPTAASSELPADWRVIGQYLNSYLLCQAGDQLVLIDQHAAHERIGFERLRQQLRAGRVASQALLFPLVIELEHREATLFTEVLDRFDRFGFEIAPFGGRSFSVQAVPHLLTGADPERLVRDVAAELNEIDSSAQVDAAFEKVLMVMACHAMVRAGQALSLTEMQALVRELAEIGFGSCCPHGRPVLRRLTRNEIEKLFHRT
ncbi:MAG: DNA mismatch repair endonuclease MutL [Desulfuromonadales bacterium]|nr:DNA mismatch repair endonuclease MutL [Desulfuromonadales bacterium]